MVQCKHAAGAAKAGNDFVGGQQHVVLVADLANALEVARWRHIGTTAADGFDQKQRHGIGPLGQDGTLQLIGGGGRRVLPRCHRVAVGVVVGNVHKAGHARLKGWPIGRQAGGAHGRQRGAVVAAHLADGLDLARLAHGLPVVARGLDGAVGRFTAAGGEEKPVDVGVGQAGQAFAQRHGLQVAAARVARGIGQCPHLRCGSRHQRGLAVTQGHVPQAGHGVDVTVAVGIDQFAAFAFDPDFAVQVGFFTVQRVHQVAVIACQQLGVEVVAHEQTPVRG